MIVRTLEEILNTDRDVKADNWSSRRLLLKKDGMGFSLHDTIVYGGKKTLIWYQNHLEAVYCLEGEGRIETLDDGKVYELKPGVLYALDKHDRHLLTTDTDMRFLCVFSPALTGQEVHDADGVYPLLTD